MRSATTNKAAAVLNRLVVICRSGDDDGAGGGRGKRKAPPCKAWSGAHHHFRFLPSKAGLIYEALGLVGDQHLCACLRLGQSVISSLERDGQTVPSPQRGPD